MAKSKTKTKKPAKKVTKKPAKKVTKTQATEPTPKTDDLKSAGNAASGDTPTTASAPVTTPSYEDLAAENARLKTELEAKGAATPPATKPPTSSLRFR